MSPHAGVEKYNDDSQTDRQRLQSDTAQAIARKNSKIYVTSQTHPRSQLKDSRTQRIAFPTLRAGAKEGGPVIGDVPQPARSRRVVYGPTQGSHRGIGLGFPAVTKACAPSKVELALLPPR